MSDVRYAVRSPGRSRGFTAAAVLMLAIGLTGTIAMFTLVNGVLLSPLPLRAEEQLSSAAGPSREFVVKDCDGRLLAFGADCR